ncbi:hypothetical protein RND81_09G052500 [Saponaria officinalis]|uniref:Uncharacterized protein n=1 Tax=Saponaria officinalis TaxID=3572 RepID=A0AAW1IIQ7_SAPOF
MANNSNTSAFNLRSVLKKDKLNAENFIDWERNLRIVLRSEGKEVVHDNPLPELLALTATVAERRARQPTLDTSVQVTCLMLACMTPDFQNVLMKHARLERFEAHHKLLECKLAKEKLVGPHVFNLIGHFQIMEKLRFPYPEELAVDIPEREHKDVLMVRKGKSFKKDGTGPYSKKDKGKEVVKSASLEKAKANPKPKVARNCRKYLEDKKNGASTSGIFSIEVNLATSSSWVFGTGCGTHIICNVQGLKRSRILEKGELDLRVGNGARVAALY